jgi:hypothetical protein
MDNFINFMPEARDFTLTDNLVYLGPELFEEEKLFYRGRIPVHAKECYLERFVKCREVLLDYLGGLLKYYPEGCDFRGIFQDLLDLQKKYYLYPNVGKHLGFHLYYPQSPHVVCFYDTEDSSLSSFLQGWFPSFLDVKAEYYSGGYGQLFYSGYVNRGTYIDCYLQYTPSGEVLRNPEIDGGGHVGFAVGDDVCNLCVRYGDRPDEIVKMSLEEALLYVKEVYNRYSDFIPNRDIDIFNSLEPLLVDRKVLIAHAAHYFSKYFNFGFERIIHVKSQYVFLTTFDAFVTKVGFEKDRVRLHGSHVSRFI